MTDERKTNGESRVQDFLLPEFEDVTLPSGLKCTLRPPSSLEFFAELGTLPSRLAAAVQGAQPEPMTGEEVVDATWRFLSKLFVHPKFSVNPKLGEHHPSRLKHDDRVFLDKWAAQYLPDFSPSRTAAGGAGSDLKTFRAEPGPGADVGEDCREVGSAPVSDAKGPGVVLGD